MQPDVQMMSPTAELSFTRNKVLRNTYLLLALSLVPTVIGAFIGIGLDFSWAVQHRFMFAIGSLAVMMGLFWAIGANRNSGLGVVLLLGLTFIMGILLGPILQVALHFSNGPQLIGMAAGGTSVIFFALAAIATVSKRDFSFLGKFLFIGLILLIVASLANIFFQMPALSLALSGVAVLLFSGFLLFDVSRIVNGGETNYIMATLAIYLDIYNLFIHLLNLLMAFAGNRD